MAEKTWLEGLGGDERRLVNLSRKELMALPNEKLVDIIGWQQSGTELMYEKLQRSELEVRHFKSVVDRLSIDPTTGVFTAGALAMMTDILIGSQVLEFLKLQGFTLKLCVLDVDELKKHNSIGGRAGGDAVLAEVTRRLRMLYRRKSDVVAHGVDDFVGSVTGSFEKRDTGNKADKGDEMIAWRFAAPIKDDVRRGGWKVANEAARVKQGFEGACVSYQLLNGLTEADIKKFDPEGRFKVRSGIVTAPISVTFACVYAPMPVDRTEVRRIIRRASELILLVKSSRIGRPPKGSVGEAVNLTEDDLTLA
jgi:GGDEF domain-containing protein